MNDSVLACLVALFVVALVGAAAAVLAALWARDTAHKVDGLAIVVLDRVPAIVVATETPPTHSVALAPPSPAPPVIAAEEIAPSTDAGDPERATIKTEPRPGDEEPYTEAEKAVLRARAEQEAEARSRRRDEAVNAERARAEAAQDETDGRWRGGAPSLVDAVEPPQTGPSMSGERPRRDAMAVPLVDARGEVVVPLPPPPAPPPPDFAAIRRQAEEQAARFGAEDAEAAVCEAREQRKRAEATRIAAIAEEALRPSVDPEEYTHVYAGKVDLGRLLAAPPAVPNGSTAQRIVPGRARTILPAPITPRPRPPQARREAEETQLSSGVRRSDPRVEP